MSVILSIDQSTQGTKGLVWSFDGALLGRADVPHRQLVSGEGWVSHDLAEIWESVQRAAREALAAAGVSPRRRRSGAFQPARNSLLLEPGNRRTALSGNCLAMRAGGVHCLRAVGAGLGAARAAENGPDALAVFQRAEIRLDAAP